MTLAVETSRWTPQLVEELLFRQYIKNEDVNALLPPTPAASSTAASAENYDKSTKMLFNYVRNGPLAALTPHNVNTPTPTKSAAYAGISPAKTRVAPPSAATRPPSNLTSTTRAPTPVQRTGSRTASPKQSASAGPPAAKRAREWPAEVPTNRALCSSSRSKVQPLTALRLAAQEDVDPDLVFRQNTGEIPLHVIFAKHPKILKSISEVRNASGDWRQDTFTPEEESFYKKELGYRYIGPSQCVTAQGGYTE